MPDAMITKSTGRKRMTAIDMLRGVVLVIMALDHVRDMVSHPLTRDYRTAMELGGPVLALFFTRWITHICAPTFIFLAGASAFLYGAARQREKVEIARFLALRGAWLVFIELTVVNFAWSFNLHFTPLLQVIWAIGWSMIALALLIWLPRWIIAAVGLGMIVAHNALDSIQPIASEASSLWMVLHIPGVLRVGGMPVAYVLYPLIPWIGVMALGYAAGSIWINPDPARPRRLVMTGGLLILFFVLLRLTNLYGEPSVWALRPGAAATIIGFLETTKYPPSLQYLLMTLGPALMLLGWFERFKGRLAAILIRIGRVPFFYYVVHLYLIHAIAVFIGLRQGFGVREMAVFFTDYPINFGLPLGGVYLIWVATLLVLYPACAWFDGIKARRRDWWLKYL